MSRRRIQWARVEYQPDLTNPREPIPLGVIVSATDLRGAVMRAGAVVLGREPKRGQPPAELRDVGPLGLAQLTGWIFAAGQDILQAQRDPNPFQALHARWRWNIYITDVQEDVVPAGASLFEVGRRLYRQHVKEPFPHIPLVQRPTKTRTHGHRRPFWSPAKVEYGVPLTA